MNGLFIALAATAGLVLATIIYLISMKLAKNKLNKAFAGSMACLALIAGCVAFAQYSRYKAYGAFYDDSWRDPSVEGHFRFKTDDTDDLQAIYDSDPGNFRFELYDVILVRLGCEDCEENEGRILAAKAEIEEKKGRPAYIVFSRSDIGKRYVDRYSIRGVPTVIVDDTVIELFD